ncbi:MAG: hypothetical protein A2525_05645 [Sulfurimonas sp. RIFOXYD12_FULL_36_11]|nr:MAG: hypothetical protein A2525_05645 [Sulfurimonas sp. RIFOXYD12_FULL_36_11]OHE18890.1 MAG: hypothetical protein A2540_06815 [Sulfurimonas sp. RIFOXYD2_FULL_37_8]
MEIHERLKLIREKIGLNQTSFAEVFSVTQRTLSNWETGRNEPSLSVLQKISRDYNINMNWLITGVGKMTLESFENINIPAHITILVNKSFELNPSALTENLIKFILENSVKQKLRNYDKSVPFLKYLFWDRYDTLANFRLMIRVLKTLEKDDLNNLKVENSKIFLIDLIKNYQIGISDNIGYAIRNKDKENTLKWIEDTFDELEAYSILMDLEPAIKAFDEAIGWLSFHLPILKIKGEEV